MTRTSRVGIVAAACVALLFVAGAFVLDGYLNAAAPRPVLAADPTATQPAAQAPQTIYVLPPASPEIVRVTRTEAPAAQPVLHVVVPLAGEHEQESGDDD